MEIVAPAGNFEKLTYALAYGADACYLAWQNYGLRAFADNFSLDELKSACLYAHERGKKIYLTLNIFAQNKDINELPVFLAAIGDIGLDAVIVSEPGTFALVKQYTSIPIHISTQANTTNWQAVKFWHELGAKRIIMAREVSYAALCEIQERVPEAELEVFIHGAMCMAWSGRCLMSALLNSRSGNQGQCTHPCRWEWNLTEPTREGQEFSIEEDKYGSYLMFSKDLCLINEIPKLVNSGIHSGKIEGRMKSVYYTALMSRTYKEAANKQIDHIADKQALLREVNKVNHRPYFTGFFYDDSDQSDNAVSSTPNPHEEISMDSDTQLSEVNPFIVANSSGEEWQFCGKVTHYSEGLVWFDCLSKIVTGDRVEIIFPDRTNDLSFLVADIIDVEKSSVSMTKPNQQYAFSLSFIRPDFGLVRKLVAKHSSEVVN